MIANILTESPRIWGVCGYSRIVVTNRPDRVWYMDT